jgi:uncharacterized protein (DUF305 family)
MNITRLPRRVLRAGVAGAAVLALAAGCGDDGGSMPGMDHGGNPAATTAAAAPGASFNDADVAFAQNMIPHHQQAVQMADLAAGKAGNADLKQLAAQIKAAQDPEIKTMTGWLTAWGKPAMPAGGHGGMSMPGMMSDADMNKLTAATGTGFDRMFAQMMIAHHNGAIQMAKDEQAKGANPEAKALAATIEKTQAAEVTKIQQILDKL